MKKISISLLLLLLVGCNAGSPKVTATYQSADIGGGGYIPGLIQNPEDPNILYARSDVGGVFKSVDGAHTWRSINNGVTKMFNHSIHSLILDPKEPNTLYRASGELRDNKMVGNIHRSCDGGESWQLMTDKLDYFGNGQSRMCGELLAVDPFDHNTLVAGSFSQGVWISHDRAESWEYLGLKGERMSVVKFDPKVRGRIYISTLGESAFMELDLLKGEALKQGLKDNMDFARGAESKVFLSNDYGKSFSKIFENDTVGVHDIAFSNGGKNIICATNKGIYIKRESDKTFVKSASKIFPMDRYQTITASPINDSIVYTASKFSKEGILNVFVSKDCGESWDYYSKDLNEKNLFEYPTYGVPNASWLGASISMLLPDVKDENKLFLTNWWGVNVTYDGGRNFYGHHFKGLEMTCLEYIQKNPANRDNVTITICDHGPMVAKEGGKQYNLIENGIGASKAFANAKSDENFIIYSSGDARYKVARLFVSHNLGKDQELIMERHGGAFIQCLKEDPFKAGRYWMMMEGEIGNPAEDGGIHVSDDWGKTWRRVANPYPSYIKSTPYNEVLINRDILPIIPYQFKNAAGTNQLLAVDGNEPDVVYTGEWTEGLYRTKDGGESWTDISAGLPFHSHKSTVLSFIYTDPSKAGHLYVGFWREGMWRSADYGESWERVYPTEDRLFNAVAMAIDEDVWVLACPNSIHSDVDAQLLVSLDEGKSWQDIYDDRLGALNFKSVDVDAQKQKIYIATSGQGIFHASYEIE